MFFDWLNPRRWKLSEAPPNRRTIQAGDSLDDIIKRCYKVMQALIYGGKDSMQYETAAAIWILAQEIKTLKAAAEAPKKTRKRNAP